MQFYYALQQHHLTHTSSFFITILPLHPNPTFLPSPLLSFDPSLTIFQVLSLFLHLFTVKKSIFIGVLMMGWFQWSGWCWSLEGILWSFLAHSCFEFRTVMLAMVFCALYCLMLIISIDYFLRAARSYVE